ncbi:hypothetical protein ACVWZW_006099 [Bradyrhizobium sp. F1.13.4]
MIDGERQQGRGKAAEQHEHPVLGLEPGKDVIAEAGLPDRGRQRRGADHPHCGGTDASHHHRESQRQFDHHQRLRCGHSDALRGLDQRGIDAVEAGDAIAQHWQHRIERQRQHRRQEAESGEGDAEPGQRYGGREQQERIEQREQRQSGHRLHDAGEREHHGARRGAVAGQDRQRQADHQAERKCGKTHPDVVAEIVGQMPQRLAPARIGEKAHAAPLCGSSAFNRSTWRRGVRSNSST